MPHREKIEESIVLNVQYPDLTVGHPLYLFHFLSPIHGLYSLVDDTMTHSQHTLIGEMFGDKGEEVTTATVTGSDYVKVDPFRLGMNSPVKLPQSRSRSRGVVITSFP